VELSTSSSVNGVAQGSVGSRSRTSALIRTKNKFQLRSAQTTIHFFKCHGKPGYQEGTIFSYDKKAKISE